MKALTEKSRARKKSCQSGCRGNCDHNCRCAGKCEDECGCNCNCDDQPIYCGSRAGGDLYGSYPCPGVKGLRGIEIAKIMPAMGQTLVFDGQFYVPSFGTNTTPTGPAGGDLGGTYPNPTVIKLQGYPITGGNPGAPGQVLTWNGSVWLPQTPNILSAAAGGDLGGSYPNPTVERIQGVPVAAGIPLNGQILTYNGFTLRWEPSAALSGPAGQDLRGTYPNPFVQGLQGYSISNAAPINGQVLTWDNVHSLWTPTTPFAIPLGPAGGDLSGTYPNPNVKGLLGRPLAVLPVPTAGQVLSWDGTNWTPTSITLTGSATGDVTGPYSGTLTVVGLRGRGVAPIAPSTGQGLIWDGLNWTPGNIALTGPAGGDLFGSYPSPSVVKIQGQPISSTAPLAGQFLSWNGSNWIATTLTGLPPSGVAGGDLSGSYPNPTVAKILGQTVSSVATLAGQVLIFNGSTWVPQTPSFSSTPTGPASGDLGGTYPAPLVTGLQNRPVSNVLPSSNQVLAWNGSVWTPTNAATVALPAATNNGQILTYNGSNWVSSTASLPSSGQVLTWNGSSWVPQTPSFSGSASGDVSGTYPGPLTVTGLQNHSVSAAVPVLNQVLSYNGAQWIPTSLSTFGPQTLTYYTNTFPVGTSPLISIYGPVTPVIGLFRFSFYAIFQTSLITNTASIDFRWADPTGAPYYNEVIVFGGSQNPDFYSITYNFTANMSSINPFTILFDTNISTKVYITLELLQTPL